MTVNEIVRAKIKDEAIIELDEKKVSKNGEINEGKLCEIVKL